MVHVKKTSPQTVIDDYAALTKMFRMEGETVMKLNLSWTKYFPSCSTEPWQLEGVLSGLDRKILQRIHVVENRTVVTDPQKGCINNRWRGVLDRFGLKFTSLSDVEWVEYRPKAQMLSLDELMPDRMEAAAPLMKSWVVTPEELVLREESRARLEHAVLALPKHYRLVLILRDMDQLDTKEVAEVLEISEDTVKMRLHRARVFVRNELEKSLGRKKTV